MISMFTLCAALASVQVSYGNAFPPPFPTPLTMRDSRPRFLREANSLPARGILKDGVITLPLQRRAPSQGNKQKRQTSLVQVPVADNSDVSYGVALDIGGQTVTFQLDTGSADLWSMTSDCQTPSGGKCTNSSGIPAYNASSTFQPLNLTLQIDYGGSNHSTFASGTIGTDNVTFAGLTQTQQVFASMNKTNNTITDTYSGIFGVGFPDNSEIVTTLVKATLNSTTSLTGQSLLNIYLAAMQRGAPLLAHLADAGKLQAPMFTLSFQREDPTSAGSNAGVMTIGGLPSGISNASLTWVPVKEYPTSAAFFSGLGISQSVINAATKILPSAPFAWEAVIDGLYVNGQLQANSSVNTTLTKQVGLTALFDSGTTQTLITANDIKSTQFPSTINRTTGILPCDTAINIAFGIGGKQFAIDPLDLVTAYDAHDSKNCSVGLGQADPPTESSTNSYVLGDAFFRSNLVAFYWGNLTNQTSDPARMGFLSTVNITEADAAFASFWHSVGTTFTFPTPTAAPAFTTTSIANPISAGVNSGNSSSHSGAERLGYFGFGGVAVTVTSALLGAVLAFL